MKPLTIYTCKVTSEQAELLRSYIEQHGFKARALPYTRFAATRGKLNVVVYRSSKLVVQGKDTEEFVRYVLEPEILKEARLGYEEVLNPENYQPHIGVDESGKGDFFGPLCVAAVYVNPEVVRRFEAEGIKDSKRIRNDERIEALADFVRETNGCVYSVVPIGNAAYNRLFEKMENVNRILAWGHARAIENVMEHSERMKPPPRFAISDQFARAKSVIARALMKRGQALELVQRHKAESDTAVAAASILARASFTDRLRRLGSGYRLRLPKGAGVAVDETAARFVREHGAEALVHVAKVHFRTAPRAIANARTSNDAGAKH